MEKEKSINWGRWAFIVGLIVAIIVSIINAGGAPDWAVIVLAVLGIIVGIMNVTDKESQAFLLATIGFLISFATLGNVIDNLALGWPGVSTFFNLISIFIAPAAIIVAVKSLFNITKD